MESLKQHRIAIGISCGGILISVALLISRLIADESMTLAIILILSNLTILMANYSTYKKALQASKEGEQ